MYFPYFYGICLELFVKLFHESPRTKISYSMITEMAFVLYYSYYLRNAMLYRWTVHDVIIPLLVTLTMLGRLKATFPHLAKPQSDTLNAFRLGRNNIMAYLEFMIIFIPGFVMRMVFVHGTPDEIYAPLITSKKFSTEPDVILQNDDTQFVPCQAVTDADCIPPDTPDYYKALYNNGTHAFQLRSYQSVRQYWDDTGLYFFSFVNNKTDYEDLVNETIWYVQ